VHLTAAGLLGREDDLVAKAFEDGSRCPTDLRADGVADARDEERDAHEGVLSD
jgi:hypothetical protein